MIALDVQVDVMASQRALDWLAANLRVSQRSAMYELGRLTAGDLLRRTPPLNQSMKLHQPTGRKAVQRDVHRVVQSLQYYRDQGAKLAKTRDGRVVIEMLDGEKFFIAADRYDPMGTRIHEVHQSRRNAMTGRVPKSSANDLLVVDRNSTVNKYISSVWQRVGSLASGWIVALLYCAPRSPVPNTPKIPGWVARHGNVMGGTVIDTLSQNAAEGVLEFRVPWRFGYPSKLKSLWTNAARTRERDADRWMRLRLEKLVARFNAPRAA